MRKIIALTIDGKRFTLTAREAEFLAVRLGGATQLTSLPATFAHKDSESGVSLRVEWIGQASRPTAPTRTDC